MTKLLITFFFVVLSAVMLDAANDRGADAFVETYDDGTDIGLWHCSTGVPRIPETSGGNPGAYIQQGGFSTSIRHGRASRRVFNREFPTPTRLTVSTPATGPRSVLPA